MDVGVGVAVAVMVGEGVGVEEGVGLSLGLGVLDGLMIVSVCCTVGAGVDKFGGVAGRGEHPDRAMQRSAMTRRRLIWFVAIEAEASR